jgi:hypothetical protein
VWKKPLHRGSGILDHVCNLVPSKWRMDSALPCAKGFDGHKAGLGNSCLESNVVAEVHAQICPAGLPQEELT